MQYLQVRVVVMGEGATENVKLLEFLMHNVVTDTPSNKLCD